MIPLAMQWSLFFETKCADDFMTFCKLHRTHFAEAKQLGFQETTQKKTDYKSANHGAGHGCRNNRLGVSWDRLSLNAVVKYRQEHSMVNSWITSRSDSGSHRPWLTRQTTCRNYGSEPRSGCSYARQSQMAQTLTGNIQSASRLPQQI